MTLYTRLCSAVLFPLHERLKGHRSVALRKELERTQWLDREQLEALRVMRLREFLADAARSVPYYRVLFDRERFDPQRLSAVADLSRVPFLTKSLIRENVELLKRDAAGPLARYNTGGSSGEPLVFYMGLDRVTHDVAAKWRATRWWGVDIGDPEAVLWGSPIEIGGQDHLKALRDRALRSHLLPAFDMSEPKMDEYLRAMRRMRPRMVFGYASALALLAERARTTGVALNDLPIRVVFTTGETLYPQQRQVIEAVFGAPVANGYGARDAGFIAHQCPSGGMHLSAEHIIVEIIDENGANVPIGQPGEVVITHIATGEFPFIRYRTGDVAAIGEDSCPCGRGLPVLEAVHGRSTDFIHTRSGTTMHALALIYEVRDRAGVRAFKFIQAEDLSIELQIVPGPEFGPEVEEGIRAGLRRRLGPETPMSIVRTERIAPEKSGKYRYVVSRGRSDRAPGVTASV